MLFLSGLGESESGGRVQRLKQLGLIVVFIVVIGILSIVLAALSATVFGLVYASGANAQRLDVFLAFVAVAANIALTSGLILVYLNQNQTLKREAGVLEDQQELMKAQMKPIIGTPHDFVFRNPLKQGSNGWMSTISNPHPLRNFGFFVKIRIPNMIESFSVGNVMATDSRISNDSFRFKLSNSGYGIAKNFRLWLKLDVTDEKSEYDGGWSRPALTRLDRLSLYKFAENTIPAGQEDIEFEAPVKLKVIEPPDDNGAHLFSTYDFSRAAKILNDDGVEDIAIRWKLTYEDVFEEEYEDEFLSKRSELVRGMDFSEFMRAETPTITYVNKRPEENQKETKSTTDER